MFAALCTVQGLWSVLDKSRAGDFVSLRLPEAEPRGRQDASAGGEVLVMATKEQSGCHQEWNDLRRC